MEALTARTARLVWQRVVRRADNRVADCALGPLIPLELGLDIVLEEHKRIEHKPILAAQQLLHSKEPCAPLCLANTDALNVTDFDTV